MSVPLPWERLLWRGRSARWPPTQYVLTDLRIVSLDTLRGGRPIDEVLLRDIGEVGHSRVFLDRVLGTSTITIRPYRTWKTAMVLRHVRHGAQLAALLDLLSADPQPTLDATAVRAALEWDPQRRDPGPRTLVAGLILVLSAVFAVSIGMRGNAEVVTYAPDDAIYPAGKKRDHAAIVRFMETEVMPWARATLGPLKGGADQVTCATCHGATAEARGWQMPAVSALPEPHVKVLGWETYSGGMDTQMRNAIYGYAAESDNQTRAAYMREVVMPGMARLLHRPAYDFTRTYNYNRSRLAFGCYHCHNVR
jgi:hypothetical protein